jgi:hypothetical protein
MRSWSRIVTRSLKHTGSSLELLGLEADLLRREGRLALRAIRAEEASLLSARRRLRAARRERHHGASGSAALLIAEPRETDERIF